MTKSTSYVLVAHDASLRDYLGHAVDCNNMTAGDG